MRGTRLALLALGGAPTAALVVAHGAEREVARSAAPMALPIRVGRTVCEAACKRFAPPRDVVPPRARMTPCFLGITEVNSRIAPTPSIAATAAWVTTRRLHPEGAAAVLRIPFAVLQMTAAASTLLASHTELFA